MNCSKARKWLIKKSKSISHAQRAKLDRHIEMCDTCQQVSRSLDKLEEGIHSAKWLTVPNETTQDMWQHVSLHLKTESESKQHQTPTTRSYRTPWVSWGVPSFAAVCILCLFLLTKPWRFLASNEKHVSSSLDVTIESAQIDGKAAQISIFEIKNPEMTFIWLDRVTSDNGG